MEAKFTKAMADFIYSKKKELGFHPGRHGYKGCWTSPREYEVMYTYAKSEGFSDESFIQVDNILVDAYQLAREGYMDVVRDLLIKAVQMDREIWDNHFKA